MRVRGNKTNQKHILAGAGALHLVEQHLPHCVHEVAAEVARVQENLVLQGYLRIIIINFIGNSNMYRKNK